MRNIWESSVNRLSDTIAISVNGTAQNDKFSEKQRHKSPTKNKLISNDPTIVFVLPLAGRFHTFQRFLKNYEEVCIKLPETKTELLIVLFKENGSDVQIFQDESERLKIKYPGTIINFIMVVGNFSRGVALNQAIRSEYIQMNDILFFIDVDITFKFISIERIRLNTKQNEQVYLPIVFSQYNPQKWDGTRTTTTSPMSFNGTDQLDLDNEIGYFRQFGYGICAIYKADIIHPAINGFNDDITGWGLEDVKFLEKIIKLHQMPTATSMLGTTQSQTQSQEPTKSLSLRIFRAPDPSLVHIYHDIYCDKSLSESQYSMCLGTKANTLGTFKYIESVFMNNKSVIDFIRSTNTVS